MPLFKTITKIHLLSPGVNKSLLTPMYRMTELRKEDSLLNSVTSDSFLSETLESNYLKQCCIIDHLRMHQEFSQWMAFNINHDPDM